jgi:hypothetical protein
VWAVLGPVVGCLGRSRFLFDLAPNPPRSSPNCALIPAPYTFFPLLPFHPLLPHTSPSLCPRCTAVVLCFPFCFLHPQHLGSAFHSFKAIHHAHFCWLLFPLSFRRSLHLRPSAPTRLELILDNRPFIHLQLRQANIYISSIRSQRTRDLDLSRD